MAGCSSSSRLAAQTVVEDERYCVLPSRSNVGAAELLRHLGKLLALYLSIGQAGVNDRLPSCDPWNIPGMPFDEGAAKKREKYFVTDCSVLKSSSTAPATRTGYWKPRELLGWGVHVEGIGPARFGGLKTTYDFHIGDTIYKEGSKGTSWIMDVYFVIDQETSQVEDDLVLCHVFKGNSRDYNPRPRCPCTAQHHKSPNKKEVCNQVVHDNSNNFLLEMHEGLLSTQINSNKHLSPPNHVPQLQHVSHHQESNGNEDVCNQTIHAQSNNFLLERPAGLLSTLMSSIKHLSPPNHVPQPGCVSHLQASNRNGEPNHEAIFGQSNGHLDSTDMELSPDTDNVFTPLSPLLSLSGENLANMENTVGEISMDIMIENDMPNGVSSLVSREIENYKPNEGGSSTVLAGAKDGPLGKRARTKSPVWKKFTKLFTKSKAVLSVCNHCGKVMKGDSRGGTSHMIRHKCHRDN